MSESDDIFTEIQDEGMADIGCAVQVDMDGNSYQGTINSPDAATMMMTGAYQGRSVLQIRMTKTQFATPPAQRGEVLLTDAYGQETQWQRKEVSVEEVAHYVMTILRQLPTT